MLDPKLNMLTEYKLGGPESELFILKIQQKTGWSKDFSLGAIDEYKRFIYLTTVSKSALTPSVAVDEVWHLHLTFSRCYWGTLCKKILADELHHEPATSSELGKTQNQYRQTLELYHRYFDRTPPGKYWPMGVAESCRPNTFKNRLSIALLAVFSLLILGSSGSVYAAESSGGSTITFWVVLLGILVGAVGLVIWIFRDGGGGSGGSGGWSGCGGGGGCGGG